jgi:L,D-transpeptidase YcbB
MLRYPLMVAALLGLFPVLGLAQPAQPIKSLITAGRIEGMRWPDFGAYRDDLEEFYAPAGYAPAWLKGTTPTPQADVMVRQLQDAWQKGLDPEDYDASRWDQRRAALQRGQGDSAAFDVALTVAAMRYLSDLSIGRVNPKHLKFDLHTTKSKQDLAQFLRQQVLPAGDLPATVASIEPRFGAYRRTEEALLRYTELVRQDEGEKLAVPAKAIEPGQPYASLPRLTQLLRLLGDLPPDVHGAAVPTSYDPQLVEGVKHFQGRHGLDADGRLGAATVKQLNVPLAERVRQLQLTLERWRWLPENFSAPPIVVNIPDFRLRTLDGENRVTMEMRVVVGKAMHTETPVFSRDMSYVVFRPYWVVPPGIMRRQIIPAIQKDRGYIAKNRYEVTSGGTVVTSGLISDDVLAQLRAGRLGVRQKPGPKNALGLVKLMFPNEYAVYLHSTPSTELFANSRRDFSSGCIRVEKPAELTAWVLRNNPGWPLERVQQAMDSGRDDVTVRLDKAVPVFIVYGTAIAYENGEVHFYDDLYGHDRKLAELLSKGRASGG